MNQIITTDLTFATWLRLQPNVDFCDKITNYIKQNGRTVPRYTFTFQSEATADRLKGEFEISKEHKFQKEREEMKYGHRKS